MKKYSPPVSLLDVFQVGMDRFAKWPTHIVPADKELVNLGAGNKIITGAVPLDLPDWAAGDRMPWDDDEVGAIYAFHFFEHLTKDEIINTLWECERVLCRGGILYTVTPHWDSEAAHQDLDHKSFWSESTWKNLFDNPYYDGSMPRDWKLYEVQSIIMGLVQRNLVVVSMIERG